MGLREWGRRIDEETVARHRSRQPSPVPMYLVLLYAAGLVVILVVPDLLTDRTDHVVIQVLATVVLLLYVIGGVVWARKKARQQPPAG